MNADERRLELDQITRKVISCVYRVSNTLGCGFLEKVYENALVVELNRAGVLLEQQRPVRVFYGDSLVGEYMIDLLVEDSVILELKAARDLDGVHVAQCMNYLKAAKLQVCLLINFGRPRAQIKRIVANF